MEVPGESRGSNGEAEAIEEGSGRERAQRQSLQPPQPPTVAAARPVTVHAFPSGGYVWDVAAAERIRAEHGIVGAMAGGLPGFALQNKVKGLPLLLSQEELAAAATIGVARLRLRGDAPDAEAASHAAAQAREQQQQQSPVLPAASRTRTSEAGREHARVERKAMEQPTPSPCAHPRLLASACPHHPPCSVPRALHAAREPLGSEKFRLPVTEGDVAAAVEWVGARGCGLQQQGAHSPAPVGMEECSVSRAADCSEEKGTGGEETGGGEGEVSGGRAKGRSGAAKEGGGEWDDAGEARHGGE
ncbi:hypothetical protein CLOM_g13254 [Closterium sp. NIES-68]|nr:hypothetical protein CLOM_g13254 [Closterium sp. NIES-68]GJP57498.1 hypothetical protein CLOP_g12209 [Closterium sp. NIES-67]